MPDVTAITARGPFTLADEELLLDAHGIEVIVCKNSGGTASLAKLQAARARGLPVLMLQRPAPPDAPRVTNVAAALDWLSHALKLRGV